MNIELLTTTQSECESPPKFDGFLLEHCCVVGGIIKSPDGGRVDVGDGVKSGGIGSSSEEEESDEVDFKDDQSLSDKLIASTDRLRFSPDASVVSSLYTFWATSVSHLHE